MFSAPGITDAAELIDSCRGVAAELDGFRGTAPLDRAALCAVIVHFALLFRQVPEVIEASDTIRGRRA